MEKEKTERRGFFSKIAKLFFTGGIAALVLGRGVEKTVVPPVHASGDYHYSSWEDTVPVTVQGYCYELGPYTQKADLQRWVTGKSIDHSCYYPIVARINKDGWLGIGENFSPSRYVHLRGNNACFRMDRDVNSAAFILHRTSPGFGTPWKTFYVGVDASGVNNGEFFIGDAQNQVSGASIRRLWIDNSGAVHIPNLASGDITFANGVVATEEGSGLAFKNDSGEKIAVLDREGNLQVKGKITENPNL